MDAGVEFIDFGRVALNDIFAKTMDMVQIRGVDKHIEVVVTVLF